MRRPGRRTARAALVALALCAALAAAVPAQEGEDDESSLSDLEGDWWLSIEGGKGSGGAARLHFGPPAGGAFDVSGFGLTAGFGRFRVADGEFLELTSQRRIHGSLVLESVGDAPGPDGVLEVTDGKVKGDGSLLKLKGTLEGDAVKLRGGPVGDTEPVLSGRNPEANVGGDGLKSNAYDLSLGREASDGFPLFDLVGEGPVEIDSVETPGVEIDGEVIVDPKGKTWGNATSPEFGEGPLRGKLVEKEGGVPRAKFRIDADRIVKLRANLKEAVDPRIQVEPTETVDFGTLELGESAERTFLVSNAGAAILDGQATLEDLGQGFAVVAGSPYSLDPADAPASVKVRYEPVTPGAVETQVLFSGGGGAVRSIAANAVAASVSIEPLGTLDIGDVVVEQTGEGTFTITNNTTQPIDVTVTVVSGAPTFQVRLEPGAPASSVELTGVLAGTSRDVIVVFDAPALPSDETGIVRFDVGDAQGPTRNVIASAVLAVAP